MKKIFFIVILAICTAVSGSPVSAQETPKGCKIHVVKWYEDIHSISKLYSVPEEVIMEFNSLVSDTLKSRQVLLIPENYKKPEAAADSLQPACPLQTEDSLLTDDGIFRIGMVLPFHDEREAVNNNSIDFYCGALMAIRQVSEEGLDIILNVNDFSQGIDSAQLSKCKFIIGPIRSADVTKTIRTVGTDKLLVSPLDAKVDQLLPQYPNLVQAAVSSANQWKGIKEWQTSPYRPQRWVVVTGEYGQATDNDVLSLLKELGYEFTEVKCGVSGDIQGWESIYDESIDFNVVLAINNEAVLNNAVRNMSIAAQKGNVSVFCNSRVRSYDSIPVENLHRAEIRAFCSYYVEYTDEKTLDFIHKYRALYSSEPSQFAFQGYDLTYFMLKTWSKYGNSWKDLISSERKWQMLQTCFKFVRQSNGSLMNEGIRIVEYRKDWTVRS